MSTPKLTTASFMSKKLRAMRHPAIGIKASNKARTKKAKSVTLKFKIERFAAMNGNKRDGAVLTFKHMVAASDAKRIKKFCSGSGIYSFEVR